MPQLRQAGVLESPGVYGIFEATRSRVPVLCSGLSPLRRVAVLSFAATSPTSVLPGKSCTAHLRRANRRKLQDSCDKSKYSGNVFLFILINVITLYPYTLTICV